MAELDDVRFHDLRHTLATRLAANGVSVITIQKLLGHSTDVVTMRYVHSRDDLATSAVAMLDRENTPENAPVCDRGVTAKNAEILANPELMSNHLIRPNGRVRHPVMPPDLKIARWGNGRVRMEFLPTPRP